MKNITSITKMYLKSAPISLTIREVSRINALILLNKKYHFSYDSKILDVGCGDGVWWRYIDFLDKAYVTGIDISKREVRLANKIIKAKTIDITNIIEIEKLDKNFDLVIGNCSLEHIFDIETALFHIYNLIRPNGKFILFVPSPHWALNGKLVNFLNNVSPRLSMSFSGLINGFFQHWHLYNHKIWSSLLKEKGLKITSIHGLGNSRSEYLFRLFLIPSFFSFIFKSLTNRYLTFYLSFVTPPFIKNKISQIITRSLEQELLGPDTKNIFEYVIVCEK